MVKKQVDYKLFSKDGEEVKSSDVLQADVMCSVDCFSDLW